MGTLTSYDHGHFCWVDYVSHNLQTAKEFYSRLLGWKAAHQDTQGGPPYVVFELDGQRVAGLGEMNDEMRESGMPPTWNSYVQVDDIGAAVDRAVSLGAALMMPPMQIMSAGHMAVIQDPTQAVLALWQKIDHFGAERVNEPNCWVWNELMTRDPQRAIEFYGEAFGWRAEQDEQSPGEYWIVKNQGQMNGGIMKMPAEMEGVPPYWSVYFATADLDATTARVTELGGKICAEPFDVSVGRIAVVSDDLGGTFQLIQLSVPPDR